MECSQCKISLSIQDLEKNEWQDDAEVFIIKCPVCEHETKLVSSIFEETGHISNQYLRMIIVDSKFQNKEKLTDYMPEQQRRKLFQHLSSCHVCSDKIESMRLLEISKEIEFNENAYKFFITRAKDIIKELDPSKVKSNGRIKSFVYEDQKYDITEENLFCHHKELLNGVDIERLCYNLERNDFSIGMVSFVKSNGKIILEKIWLKSEQRIEKEKQFLTNLRSGKIRILLELIQRLHDFV